MPWKAPAFFIWKYATIYKFRVIIQNIGKIFFCINLNVKMKCFQVVLNKLPPEIHLFAKSLNTDHSLWKNLPGSKDIEVAFPLTGDLAT